MQDKNAGHEHAGVLDTKIDDDNDDDAAMI